MVCAEMNKVEMMKIDLRLHFLLLAVLALFSACADKTGRLEPPQEKAPVYNVMTTDAEGKAIEDVESDLFFLRADTTLKNGTPIRVVLSILGHDEKTLAAETFQTTVQNSKIVQKIDLDDVLYRLELKDEDIGYLSEKILWDD